MLEFKWHSSIDICWTAYYPNIHMTVLPNCHNYDIRVNEEDVYKASTYTGEFLEQLIVWEKLND